MGLSQNTGNAQSALGRRLGEREPRVRVQRERPDRGAVRVEPIRLPSDIRAGHCCSALIAVHAAAIARNLDCTLTSLDAEGPHQLRVALRRLRIVLRTFAPVMRAAIVEDLIASARQLGRIVSDLRDADVVIDELIANAAGRDGAPLLKELNAWRGEVRGRVRASLLAARAPDFAAGLTAMAGTFAWRKESRRAKERLACELVGEAMQRCKLRVLSSAALLQDDVHDLRKDVKALRYTVELADALSANSEPKLAANLKRVQDALGFVNDMASLDRFAPALVSERQTLTRLQGALALKHANAVAANLASARTWLSELAPLHVNAV
jgi:CHAD domain-containing protein